jgi:pimeloyl-ACP methyl ester carboxylesterase
VERADVDGLTLEYEVHGSGEPVVLLHAGLCADWFKPLLDEPALAHRQLIRYHRVGYAGSSRLPGAVSLADQAGHCLALMDHLGVERAHLAGHSSSADIAMQAALDEPDRVASLALLEPALMPVPSRAEWGRTAAAPAIDLFRSGDYAGAVDAWMRGVAGEDYAGTMNRALPSAFGQAVADAPTFFEQELPAVLEWPFDEQIAARITQPALAVLGERSHEVSPVWEERQALVLAWLPAAEPFVLPDATHLLHVANPRGMAEALDAFVERHPA